MSRYSVLFVCLGNICRSPLAEVIFNDLVRARKIEAKFHAKSCGTSDWHHGEGADPRSIAIGKKYGHSLVEHQAKQVCGSDLEDFDLIVAMDRRNLADLKQLNRKSKHEIILLRNYDPEDSHPDVPDPYSGGPEGFDSVYRMIKRCCEQLLDDLTEKHP